MPMRVPSEDKAVSSGRINPRLGRESSSRSRYKRPWATSAARLRAAGTDQYKWFSTRCASRMGSPICVKKVEKLAATEASESMPAESHVRPNLFFTHSATTQLGMIGTHVWYLEGWYGREVAGETMTSRLSLPSIANAASRCRSSCSA